MQELVIFFYILAAGFLAALVWRAKGKPVRVEYNPQMVTEHVTIWLGNDFMVLMGAEKRVMIGTIKSEYYMIDGIEPGRTNTYVEMVMPKEKS